MRYQPRMDGSFMVAQSFLRPCLPLVSRSQSTLAREPYSSIHRESIECTSNSNRGARGAEGRMQLGSSWKSERYTQADVRWLRQLVRKLSKCWHSVRWVG